MSTIDKYADLRPFERPESLNLFSHWFPKVENCGIRVPKSIVVPIPAEENFWQHFYMEKPAEDRAAIEKWVNDTIIPAINASELKGKLLFIKNGCFSNKFDARHCFCMASTLVESIIQINCQSLCAESGGESEIVIRERIVHDARVTPCIYNGLPFRPEFRVFYDFTKKEVVFTANYWMFDYVHPHLYDITDKIIFEHQRFDMHRTFLQKKDDIEALVAEKMANVVGLEGPWSVDIMLTERGEPILIDMATAERSAYWELRPVDTPHA